MKNFSKLQKQAFKTNNPDFLHAVENRDFDDMADCYNEMMQYERFGAKTISGKVRRVEIRNQDIAKAKN